MKFMRISRETATEVRELTPGRRTFLKAGLALGAVALFDDWNSIEGSEATQGAETPDQDLNGQYNPTLNLLEKLDDHLIEANTLPDTIKDTIPAFAASVGYTLLANNEITKLWSGNSGAEEIVKRYRLNRFKTLRSIVVTAPLVEEGLFRALPAIGGGTKSLMPIRGIVSTYLFGKIHQLKVDKKEPTLVDKLLERKAVPEIKLDQNKVPVQQYALGGFFWMIARRRGIKHSIASHATNNALAGVALEVASHSKKYK